MNTKLTVVIGFSLGVVLGSITNILIEKKNSRTTEHGNNANPNILEGSYDSVNYENITSNYHTVLEVSTTGKKWTLVSINEDLPNYTYRGNGYYRLRFIPKQKEKYETISFSVNNKVYYNSLNSPFSIVQYDHKDDIGVYKYNRICAIVSSSLDGYSYYNSDTFYISNNNIKRELEIFSNGLRRSKIYIHPNINKIK